MRYLVVYPAHSGYAEIYNVAIIHAASEDEAKEIFRRECHTSVEAWKLDALDITEDSGEDWYYYT